MKTETKPLVIGALVVIKKGLNNVNSRILSNININEIHKITMFGTAYISRKAPSLEYRPPLS